MQTLPATGQSLVASIALAVLASLPASAEPQPDPYLWLEDIEGERALDWVREQNARTFEALEETPLFDRLYREALAIMTSDARLPQGQIVGNEFHDFWQDEDHVRGIWRRTTIDALVAGEPAWETVLDFDALAEREEENWVYQSMDCHGGDRGHCMVEMSRGGKDESVRREFSLATLEFVADGFVVPEAKNGVAWLDEDTLVVATDWGDTDSLTSSGYAREARIWERGTPLAEAQPLMTIERDDTLLTPQSYADGDRNLVFLHRLYADWNNRDTIPVAGGQAGRPLALPKRHQFEGVVNGNAIVSLLQDWSVDGVSFDAGDIIALDLDNSEPELVYRPSRTQAIDEVAIAGDSVVLQLLDNVSGRIKRMQPAAGGWRVTDVEIPDSGVAKIAAASSSRMDLFVTYESSVQPTTLYHVGASNGMSIVDRMPSMYDASNVEMRQQFATSSDGTRVPYFIIGRRDVLERGEAPTILYGYGGFLIPILPVYYENPSRPQHGALAGRMWLSRGGVLVLANIRGGGEFGPRWHEAALRENRQRAYDDYIAIAEQLIEHGITTPRKLGALGRSNGGLLLGVALTQRPDLFAALDIGVPLLDMRRYHKLLAGSSWMGEYGNPDVPSDWAFIKKYSPYQNVDEDADYPPVLFYTSTQDDRVHPGHARKMAKKLEDLGHRVYYYENMEGGHGGTANQDQLAWRTALEYAYFIKQLMPEKWAE